MADSSPAPPVVTFKKRGKAANLRKRPATPPPASDSEEYSSEDDSGARVKRRRKIGPTAVQKKANGTLDTSHDTKYAADRSKQIEDSNDATKQVNWYDEGKEDDLSARNLLGKTRDKPKAVDSNEPVELDGTYKGNTAYGNFIKKSKDAQERKSVYGPIKAATNIRTITITDFAPDVCKDYKQTGFCGFGDSCKFLHAREDYKQGWAIDKEWETATGGKAQKGTIISKAGGLDADDKDDEDAALLEKIPFKCIICKKDYKNPVVTKCGHYFCEGCALQRYRRKPDCAACGSGTGGVFNSARDLRRLLERKTAREERLREKADEEVTTED